MFRWRYFLTVFVLLLLMGCSDSTVHNPAEVKLRIELVTETPVLSSGMSPLFVAHLVNDAAESITIVLPGDGSECGMRTPIVRWNPPRLEGRRCGNINALKADEIVTLGAGERIRLKGWIQRPTLKEPGTHKVSLELENVPELEWRGEPLGQHSISAMERVRRTSAFKAVSNVVEIQVQK